MIDFSWPKGVHEINKKDKQESSGWEFKTIWGEEQYSLIISGQRIPLADAIEGKKYTK